MAVVGDGAVGLCGVIAAKRLDRAVEHLAGLDPALEAVGQQLTDVRSHRRGTRP